MTPPPADHFSAVAAAYAASRPTYPDELFDWLAAQCASRRLAWDVGAGSGQASLALAARFERVLATDFSAGQLACAPAHARIDYRVAPAERSGLPDASVDLVVVAQALHWFDLEVFYAEVRRVLAPGGVVAAWSYGVLAVEGAQVQAIVARFYRDVIGPYWPPGRQHVENGYRELPFPFAAQAHPPAFAMRRDWTRAQLLDYVRSWSATARCHAATGRDPVPALECELEAAWGEPGRRRRIAWALTLRVGRK